MLLNKLNFPVGSIPGWLRSNTIYLCEMGSVAYGCNNDHSDLDIYGVCIPPKHFIYSDKIIGYDQIDKFDQWLRHNHEENGLNYDFTIYNITRYFYLLQDQNPNILDSLFVPTRCVLFQSAIGQKIRENRHIFLSKGCYYKQKNYAFSQLHKLDRTPEGKRLKIVEQFGYDVKYASHAVRLVLQCEEILTQHDLTLDKHKEILKSIRRGEWSLKQVKEWFYEKDKYVEDLYHKSTLRDHPDKNRIRDLLIECLNIHYNEVRLEESKVIKAFNQVREIIEGVI